MHLKVCQISSHFKKLKIQGFSHAVTGLSNDCTLMLRNFPFNRLKYEERAPPLWPCSRVNNSVDEYQHEAKSSNSRFVKVEDPSQWQYSDTCSVSKFNSKSVECRKKWTSFNVEAIREELIKLEEKFGTFTSALATFCTGYCVV